jgi:hypothetical protein
MLQSALPFKALPQKKKRYRSLALMNAAHEQQRAEKEVDTVAEEDPFADVDYSRDPREEVDSSAGSPLPLQDRDPLGDESKSPSLEEFRLPPAAMDDDEETDKFSAPEECQLLAAVDGEVSASTCAEAQAPPKKKRKGRGGRGAFKGQKSGERGAGTGQKKKKKKRKAQGTAINADVVEEAVAPNAPNAVEAVVATRPQAMEPSACSDLVLPNACDENPLCVKCKKPVDVLKCRLLNKQATAYKCPACNTKHAGLSRRFGKWPIDEFKDLTEDEQSEFWADANNSSKNLDKQVEKVLEKRYMEERRATEEGAYLPLSVYATQGYDVGNIERSCTDVQDHPVLGKTYKVDINHTSRAKIQQEIRTHLLQLKSRPVGGRGRSESASSDGGRPKKRNTRGDQSMDAPIKSAKVMDSERKDKEKELAKIKKLSLQTCQRVIAKLAPTQARVENATKDDCMKFVPAPIRGAVQRVAKSIASMMNEAQSKLKSGDQLSFTLDEVRNIEEEFKDKVVVAETLMATYRKCKL